MAVKNAILKAKIENEIVELMVKTGVENIVLMDDDVEKTLADKLAEIVTTLNGKRKTRIRMPQLQVRQLVSCLPQTKQNWTLHRPQNR